MKKQQYEIIPTANGYIVREQINVNMCVNYENWNVFESFASMVEYLKIKYEP